MIAITTYFLDMLHYRERTNKIGEAFGVAFLALGVAAVVVNVIVLLIITTRQRCTCANVFYLLLINFAIVDCVKGFCLCTNAFRMLDQEGNSRQGRISVFKLDQIITLILRFCNLKTILNLIVLTLNELLFIRFPLRYNGIVTRRTAISCIAGNWAICTILSVASTMIRSKAQHVFIQKNVTDHDSIRGQLQNGYPYKRLNESIQAQEMQIHYVVSFVLTGFCLACLIIVVISYATFFRVVSKIRLKDARLAQSANRRPSEISICSSLLPNENVLSTKNKTCAATTASTPSHGEQELVVLDDRRLKRHLLKRYKYVIVLGLVIFTYMLYLIPYSTIQMIQYLYLRDMRSFVDVVADRKVQITRWCLQLLIGLHSVLQPLCCFRIKEFRSCLVNFITKCCKMTSNRFTSGSIVIQKHSISSVTGRNSVYSGAQKASLKGNDRAAQMADINHHYENAVTKHQERSADFQQSNKLRPLRSKTAAGKRISFVETPPMRSRGPSNDDGQMKINAVQQGEGIELINGHNVEQLLQHSSAL